MNKFLIVAMAAATTLAISPAMADGNGRRGGGERPSFEQLDADKNGFVTLAEIQARGAARFAEMDTNNDDSLNAEELAAKAPEGRQTRALRRANRMIGRMDTNDNGMLEVGEMQKRFDGTRIMSHLDANEDGQISAEEFEAGKGHGRRGGHRSNDG